MTLHKPLRHGIFISLQCNSTRSIICNCRDANGGGFVRAASCVVPSILYWRHQVFPYAVVPVKFRHIKVEGKINIVNYC